MIIPIDCINKPLSTVHTIQQSLHTSLKNSAIVSAFLAGVAIIIQLFCSFKNRAATDPPIHNAFTALSCASVFLNFSACSVACVLLESIGHLPFYTGQEPVLQTVDRPLVGVGHAWYWLWWHRFFSFVFGTLSVSIQVLLCIWLQPQEPKQTKIAVTVLGAFCLLPPLAFSLLSFMRFSYNIGTSIFTASLPATTPKPSLTPPYDIVPSDPRLFALLIGINLYADSQITNLKGAVRDVRAIEGYLREMLQVQHTVQTLLDREASRNDIIQGFLNLRDNTDIRRGDTILIYFAGHGTLVPSPDGWPSGGPDNKIQSIIPHDFCRTEGKRRVDIIPDFMIGGLISEISDRHGNNITVVLDCSHSGRQECNPNILYRHAKLDNYSIPLDLDRNPANPTGSVTGWKLNTARHATTGLESHVLFSACRADEPAAESNARGVFTTALLQLLNATPPDQLTYGQVLDRLVAVSGQNPQLEATNPHRLLFNGQVSFRHPNCQQVFNIYVNNKGDPKFVPVLAALRVHASKPRARRMALVDDRASADIEITARTRNDGHRFILNIPGNRVIHHSLSKLPDRIVPYIEDVLSFLNAAAEYSHHLKRSYLSEWIQVNVQVEFTRLKNTESMIPGTSTFAKVPDGPNLIQDGTIILDVYNGLDQDKCYGIKIANMSPLDLFVNVFYFDNNDLSITTYFMCQETKFTQDAPLRKGGGEITLGYGPTSLPPLVYNISPNQSVDVGFLKIFLSTTSLDFLRMSQVPPFTSGRGSRFEEQEPAAACATMLFPFVQRRVP